MRPLCIGDLKSNSCGEDARHKYSSVERRRHADCRSSIDAGKNATLHVGYVQCLQDIRCAIPESRRNNEPE
jgi:hypothetical protein